MEQGNHTGFDTGGLLDKITNVFAQHEQAAGSDRRIAPASDDPYGDPGPAKGRSIKPVSADPYRDPADEIGRRH